MQKLCENRRIRLANVTSAILIARAFTHPLPRGGTDFMTRQKEFSHNRYRSLFRLLSHRGFGVSEADDADQVATAPCSDQEPERPVG